MPADVPRVDTWTAAVHHCASIAHPSSPCHDFSAMQGEVAQLCWQQQGELDEGRHLAHERGCLLRVSLLVSGGKPKKKTRTPITFAWAGRGASSTHTASRPAGLCILPGFGSWAAQHIRRCHAKGRVGIAGPGLKFFFGFLHLEPSTAQV